VLQTPEAAPQPRPKKNDHKEHVRRLAPPHADLHVNYHGGARMTSDAKFAETGALKHAYDGAQDKIAAGDRPAIKRMVDGAVEGFRDADLFATVYHGSATAENFAAGKDAAVTTHNVGKMSESLHGDKGVATGWNDVARFTESLESIPNLHNYEIILIQNEIRQAYIEAVKQKKPEVLESAKDQNAAERLFRLRALLERVKAGDADALYRLRVMAGGLVSAGEQIGHMR
jgi:hypothetical protein